MASTLARFESSEILPVWTSRTLEYVYHFNSVEVIHLRIVDAYQITHIYFIQYISVYNATYYCSLSFSQHVSAVHGHHQVSLIRYNCCTVTL
jgi:hypothetical protein